MSDKKHGHVHHSKSTRDILSADKVLEKAGLKAGDIFMDAGCGDGFISFAASQIVGNEGEVFALDVYPESVKHIQEQIKENNIKNMQAAVADISAKIPLEKEEVDLCIMANVLHGFVENDEVDPVMREITRVVKPGGIFAVVEFKKQEGPPGPPFKVRLSPEEVEDILEQYGWEVNQHSEVGDYHYLIKAINNNR